MGEQQSSSVWWLWLPEPPRSFPPSSCPLPWPGEAVRLLEELRPALESSLTRSLCSEEELEVLSSPPTRLSLLVTAVTDNQPTDWESEWATTTCTLTTPTRRTLL